MHDSTISVDIAFLQRHNATVGDTAEGHMNVSQAHSKSALELAHRGLDGTALPASFVLGDHRDTNFSSQVYQGVQHLGEKGALALRTYVRGDEAGHDVLNKSYYYGTDSVINPA